MKDIVKHEQENILKNTHPDNKQDELAHALEYQEDNEDQGEYMKKHNLGIFKRLAEYYYGTDGIADYSSYTGKEPEVWNAAYLYTLIKYEGKDELVHIGCGEFNTEVFTRRDISELRGFSHGPLKLFVVGASASYHAKDIEPKDFLNEHTLIYSPKGGHAELRISHKQRDKGINYGDSIGIVNYQDAILALKNAQIHKDFPNEKYFEGFADKMKELKEYTPEKLHERITMKEQFLPNDDEEKKFRDTIVSCLRRLSDGNQKNMYKLVQSFDIREKAFIKPLNKKNK